MANAGHSDLEVMPTPPNPQFTTNPQQDIPVQTQYYGGKQDNDPYQQLPPYKNEQPPQSPWSPPPHSVQGYPLPQQPQLVYSQQPVQPQATKLGRICGMRKKMFWIVFAVVLVVIIGAGVGAGVGISIDRKKPDYEPYDLETGRWDMSNVPVNSYTGICAPEYLDAATSCSTFDIPFIINRSGNGYEISNSIAAVLDGPLIPPLNDQDMWTRNIIDHSQAVEVTATCLLYMNFTLRLGKNYQYEILMEQTIAEPCELDNGAISPANEECNCYSFGSLST